MSDDDVKLAARTPDNSFRCWLFGHDWNQTVGMAHGFERECFRCGCREVYREQ